MARRQRTIVVAGASVRAFAESAVRAGFRVVGVDAFGDLDLRCVADVVGVVDGATVGAGLRPAPTAARIADIPAEFAAYVSGFENHPGALRRFAAGRTLLGNSAAVVDRVRRPLLLARVLERAGFTVPAARASAPTHGRWLLKPRRSGGGHGIRRWTPHLDIGRRWYLQEWIDGTPGSVVFLADGARAIPLGVSRQLVGLRQFGADGFRYCGSILAAPSTTLFGHDTAIHATAAALAATVAREFGLVGLNGVDFVARDGVPYPIEVNPRWSASMELVERATGVSLVGLHANACAGRLPKETPGAVTGVYAKAIVFARRTARTGDTTSWLADPNIRDIPAPGERIERGRPICTVFAHAATVRECLARLERRAEAICRALHYPTRNAA